MRHAHILAAVLVAGLALAALTPPAPTEAQPAAKVYQLGYLTGGARPPDGAPPATLRQTLQDLGYVEGKNIAYQLRAADAKLEQLPALAAELASLKVDAIVTVGGPAAAAAKRATTTIPIVVGPGGGDMVATGLITSLARPGGNVTGLSDDAGALSAKRMELIKEAVPKARRIAVLWNTGDHAMTLRYQEIAKAAQALQVSVQALGVREPSDFETAFAAMTRERPDALFLVADALTTLNRKHVLEFAATHRLPAMYEFAPLVRDGGLMSYGPSQEDMFRRVAVYVDRLFKGARAAELPAEQPTRYYMAVNLKTAGALGLSIPQSVLLRADDVIQ
jgi:putative ABC transport system substrate-binding protein